MSRLPLTQWDPSLFADLQKLLALVASQPTTSLLRRFYSKLDDARPWILALTALPGPNEEDKKIIANSPISSPDGNEVRITDELLATTNTIADNLNISQLLAAVLALHAVQSRPKFPERSDPEIAVYLLHEALQTLLTFVKELLRMTVGPEAIQEEPFVSLRDWVEDLLTEQGSAGYLADVVIDQIDKIHGRLSALSRTQASGAQFELVNYRVGALRIEQNYLAGILGSLSLAGLLKSSQVVKVAKWLKKCPRPDGVAAMVYAAFCAATQPLESLSEDDARFETISAYVQHSKFIVVVCNIVFGETFAIPKLGQATKLQWSLFYLSALRNAPELYQTVNLDADGAEKHIQEAVSDDAFQFLTLMVTNLDLEPEDPTFALAERSDPENNAFLYARLEQLVFWLATKRHFLRGLKNREEDVGVRRSQAPALNFQAFLSLLAVVYKNLPPDSGAALWEETAFTSVVLDIRTQFASPATFAVLAAISVGQLCATKCYDKLKDTSLAWTGLLDFYQHYINLLPHLYDAVKRTSEARDEPISDTDFQALEGWTILLTTVVENSSLARSAMLQGKPHPLKVLFDFINTDIPTDLKALVLEAITAFVKRRGDMADDDVVARAIEYYEAISFAYPSLEVREGSRISQPIGWIQRMEHTEQDAGVYPLTRAYIHFLTAIMPSDKPRVNNAVRRGAQYIIDRVLLTSRRYAQESEHWDNLAAVIAFFEKALNTFDLTDLLQPARGTAGALADQPGFIVLLRILSENAIFTPLADVVDHASNISSPRPAIVNDCFAGVLRIYNRVLEVQLVFSDVLLLTLANVSGFKRPLGFQPLDTHLLNRLSNVIAIALAVGDADLGIAFASLKIIGALAQSPLFSSADIFRGEYTRAVNRLAGIIDSSDESIRIAQGFCERLQSEDGDDLSPEEIKREAKAVLRGANSNDLPLIIRSAILDLLVDNTADPSGPNIAHFLLGFDFRARELGLQDPRSPTSRQSCLSVILDQLNQTPPLIQLHPVLAAKSVELIHQLFSHSITGPPTMAYAESFTGFPALQLAELPRTCPQETRDVPGIGVAKTFTDEVETSAYTLVAYLDYQRYILAAVALQTFAFDGHGATSEFIAKQLFSTEDDEEDDQRPPLLLDLVSTVDLKFEETGSGEAAENKVLEFYSGFSFDEFKRADDAWYDLEMLAGALRAQRRLMERQGSVIPGTSADAMAKEGDYIIRRLAMKNRETEILIAKGEFLTAWTQTLKVSLAMLFYCVPEDRREVLLFELLHTVLDRLSPDLSPGVMEMLCEAVLITITTLVNLLSGFDNLPRDKLSATLLKVIDAVTRPGTTETARGNLYAAISQYLQLVPDAPDNALRRITVSDLGSRKDRFVAMLCRDAMDMRDVWKTECFSLLSCIVQLGDRALFAPLLASGYLAQFVRSIKDREMALQECLSPEPENLHAYWVYESKVAFLVAFAGTAKGAEELVEVGVFETFAMCGFLGVQPFSEDVINNSVALETVLRQHRALICALQLLVRVLSSATRSGTSHAISFLNAHRDSLLILLREDQAYVTGTGIDECRLIIALLTMVVPKVAADELRSASSFGAFHLAVLSLAAKFFEPTWQDAVFGDIDLSTAKAKVLDLNQVIIAYLCATTTGLKSGNGTPVLVTGTARAAGSFVGAAPSLSSAVELVADLGEQAHEINAAYDVVGEKLENGLDVATVAAESGFDATSLEELQAAFATRIGTIHNMVESLLLLIWRHLLFYTSDVGAAAQPSTLSLNFSSKVGLSTTSGPGAVSLSLKALERAAASLRGVLDRLEDVDKPDAYHAMLIRRLRELCAGLVAE